MMKILYFVVILGCFCLNACELRKHKYKKKVIVYVQANDGESYKTEEQNFDSLGKLIETIRYGGEQIWEIEKISYDSFGRRILFTITRLIDKKVPSSSNFHYIYDKNGLLSKEIITITSVKDTIVKEFFYDHEKKLSKMRTTTNEKESSWRTGIDCYYYDQKKRLIKMVACNLDGKKCQTHDSIVYTDTSKTTFSFQAEKIHAKEVQIYQHKKVKKTTLPDDFFKSLFSRYLGYN